MIYLDKPEDFKSKFEIVSCFLEHDGKFLLLHRQDHKPQGNTWGVPAGKVEDGENAVDALIREIREETGYKSNSDELNFSHTTYVRYPNYDFVYHIYNILLTKKHDVVIEEKAHKSFTWATPEEALKMELIPDEDVCIKLHYKI